LRPIQMSLAWLQSRRLAPMLACVLRDQGPLRTLEAAPPQKATVGITPHGLMPAQSRSSPDSSSPRIAGTAETFPKPKKPARLRWRASYAVTKSRGALGAIRDCQEGTRRWLTKCRLVGCTFRTRAGQVGFREAPDAFFNEPLIDFGDLLTAWVHIL